MLYLITHLSYFTAPVAQLDRASDYGSEGLGFESLQVHFFDFGFVIFDCVFIKYN